MRYWTNYTRGGLYWVGLVDEVPEVRILPGQVTTPVAQEVRRLVREHPIPFTDIRESRRAAARLNERDGCEVPA